MRSNASSTRSCSTKTASEIRSTFINIVRTTLGATSRSSEAAATDRDPRREVSNISTHPSDQQGEFRWEGVAPRWQQGSRARCPKPLDNRGDGKANNEHRASKDLPRNLATRRLLVGLGPLVLRAARPGLLPETQHPNHQECGHAEWQSVADERLVRIVPIRHQAIVGKNTLVNPKAHCQHGGNRGCCDDLSGNRSQHEQRVDKDHASELHAERPRCTQ
mmetsp:Transcript_100632/g.323088  ORF Transcript_100632/g.323088 Transcript_100632/m.323088 type:complete len:219 (-) Transcript_100632:163-819(-)